MEHETQDQEHHTGVAAEARQRHRRVADEHRHKRMGILQGVARFMGGNAHRGQRPALIHFLAQAEHFSRGS